MRLTFYKNFLIGQETSVCCLQCKLTGVRIKLVEFNENVRAIMKVNNTNLTILFIDFHRLPLSINKNHLIATDFYHYSGQNTKQV